MPIPISEYRSALRAVRTHVNLMRSMPTEPGPSEYQLYAMLVQRAKELGDQCRATLARIDLALAVAQLVDPTEPAMDQAVIPRCRCCGCKSCCIPQPTGRQ